MPTSRAPLALTMLAIIACFSAVDCIQAQKFEFKHSFKRPFYLGRGGTIPFWEYGGSTVVSEEFVRLTPAMQSRVGWLWNNLPLELNNWEILVEFEVGGGGKRGADGLALWYAAEPKVEGPIFGSKDRWEGLGVFFDTFDNDNMGDSPKISVMVNDGTKSYDMGNDGGDQITAKCHHDFRDKHIKIKLNYKSNVLQLLIESYNSWVVCATVPVKLPTGYYFGLSAATGEVTDNHDIYSFTTFNLDVLQKLSSGLQPVRPSPSPVIEERKYQQIVEPVNSQPEHQQQQQQEEQQQYKSPEQREEAPSAPATQQHDAPVPVVQTAATVDLNPILDRLREMSDEQRRLNEALKRVETEVTRRPTSTGQDDGMMAEAFEKLLHAVADIKDTSAKRYEQIANGLADLRAQTQRDREAFTKEVLLQIQTINKAMASVHAGLETAKNEQRSIQANLENNKQEIASTIERSTSFSMWIYILFFQVCFAAAYLWWRKTTVEEKKWV